MTGTRLSVRRQRTGYPVGASTGCSPRSSSFATGGSSITSASATVALASSGYQRAIRTIPKQRRQRPLYPGDPRQPTGKRQGLTQEQVQALVRMQEGLCALCRRPLGDDFVIDHDHALAEAHGHNPNVGCPRCVRGALDVGCNNFLAGFRGEPEFLARAAEYAGRRRAGR